MINLLRINMIHVTILRLVSAFALLFLTGCIQNNDNCPVNLMRCTLSFSYDNGQGEDVIAGRVAAMDYYVFTGDGMLHAKHTVVGGDYKNLVVDLPEGEVAIVAWGNVTSDDVLLGSDKLPLNGWRMTARDNNNAKNGALYQGAARVKVSRDSRNHAIALKHRHANVMVKLGGSMIDPNGDYELKVTTGESRYIFETSVKENTGGKSSYFSPFVREKEGSEHLLSSSVRPYRLFAETDGDAMVTISGVGTGGERLEHSFSLPEELAKPRPSGEAVDVFNMYEQNVVLFVNIDGEGDVDISIGITVDTEWEDGGGGSIDITPPSQP